MRTACIGLSGVALLLAVSTARAEPTDPANDPEFEKALPPLDDVAPPPQPLEMPAAPPPETDPDLAAPLVPLEGFDPTPVDAAGDVVPETGIRYDHVLEGLEGLGLGGDFRKLSALEKGKGRAVSDAQVAARAAEDVSLVEKLLRTEGYYDATVTSSVLPAKMAGGAAKATITAIAGPRYHFGTIEITGARKEPATAARRALGIETGDPIRAEAVEAGEANILIELPRHGFPFARLGARDILLDDGTRIGDYSLPLQPGPKARFGGIRTKGQEIFDVEHLSVFPRFRAGDLYDSRLVDDMRQALVATGVFSTVALRPVKTGEKEEDGTETVDIEVTQRKGPWHGISAAAGFSTGEGLKAEASWTHRNLFPPEGNLTLTATAGTREQSATAIFRRENAGSRDRSFQLGGGFTHSDFDAYRTDAVNLSAIWAKTSTPLWQKRWTWSYGADLIASRETGASLEPGGRRTSEDHLIGTLPMQLLYDASDDLLNPTRGFRVLGRLSPETALNGGFSFFTRTSLQVTGYLPVAPSLTLAARASTSAIFGAGLDDIPPSRRLYVGGGGSVRGFGYQALGPMDAEGHPTGGKAATEFALEARFRIGDQGIVPFIDAGRLSQTATPSLSRMRFGTGIGWRYFTAFGPMRVDLATPINRRPGESRLAIYVSIGQAF